MGVERNVGLSTLNSMSSVHLRPWVVGMPLLCFLALSFVACGGGGGGNNPSAPFAPSGTNAQLVVTTGDQTMLLQPGPVVSFGTGGSQNSQVMTVNESAQYQLMDGFGASLTDSSPGSSGMI